MYNTKYSNQRMENQDIVGEDSQSPIPTEQLKMKYVESLPEKLRQAYLIAKEHLGTSFTLEKSIGYLKWLETQGNIQ